MRASKESRYAARFRHACPFTLVEILAVIFMISILMALVAGGTRLAWRKAEEAKIRSRFEQMEIALDNYKRDWGYYPIQESDNELDFPMLSPAPQSRHYLEGSTEPYCQSGQGTDSFHYQYPGSQNPQKYDLLAPGVDGVTGTRDDITNWARND